MQTYEPGQIVKYANPESAEEALLRFTVLEDRETRLLVRWSVAPKGEFDLIPTECFAKEHYVLAE